MTINSAGRRVLGAAVPFDAARRYVKSSFGIIRPCDVHGGVINRRPFAKCPHLYFTAHFLSCPPSWCAVHLPDGEQYPEPGEVGSWTWPTSTVVTHHFPYNDRAVWLLTGQQIPLPLTTAHEGKWPD
jgi:hypothetical protein